MTDADLDELLELLDRGRQSWIDGALGFGESLDVGQDDDMTIFGPFGGEAGRGPGLEDRQKAVARLFHGGTGRGEVVKTIVAGNVVVVVLVERNQVVVEGSADTQPWVLRTTQVLEKTPAGWVRLHRHADPLIERRTPAETFALARQMLMGQSDPMTQNSLPAGSRSTRVVHSPASVRETDEAPAANISSTSGAAWSTKRSR